MLRTFVAVPLEAAAIASIAARLAGVVRSAAEEPLRSAIRLRWVPPENLHLTVAFLGPTDERLIPAVAAGLAPVARQTPPRELALGAAGAFPSAARPRVLWLGEAGGDEWFARLVGGARAALDGLGFALEDGRPIRAHLTLARAGRAPGPRAEVRHALGALLARIERDFAARPVPSRADRLVLYESRAVPGGVRYHVLEEWPLGG